MFLSLCRPQRSLYGRGRFSTQSHDLVKKPANGLYITIKITNVMADDITYRLAICRVTFETIVSDREIDLISFKICR